MSDHRATIDEIYAAFGRGDIPAILRCMADDVAWESWDDNAAQRAGVPWMAARNGRAGVAEFFALLGRTMEVRDFRVLDVMAGSRQVAVEFLIDVRLPATGRGYRDEEMHLWTFNDAGLVTRLRHYTDTAKHKAAAGC